jgi:hypothetical protein
MEFRGGCEQAASVFLKPVINHEMPIGKADPTG